MIKKISEKDKKDWQKFLDSKEKLEIASSICKVDLLSDLVKEFPELQGIMGGNFATVQGFEKDISLAISEHYLPTGVENRIPKKPYSVALSLTDKLDTLVGFFGIKVFQPSIGIRDCLSMIMIRDISSFRKWILVVFCVS